jgi:predicted DNA-binding antitoxin AbrB/MazE fold protein
MTITVEATFEGGAFKPAQPVSLPEGTTVHLQVSPVDPEFDAMAAVIGIGEGPPEGDGAANHDKYIYGKIRPRATR